MSKAEQEFADSERPNGHGITDPNMRLTLNGLVESMKNQAKPLLEKLARQKQAVAETQERVDAIGRAAAGILVSLGYSWASAEKEVRGWQQSKG